MCVCACDILLVDVTFVVLSREQIATCSDNNDLRLWRIIRDSYKSDEARIPGERIGSCVTYSGEGMHA